MIDAIASGLIVSGIGALVFVAYQHPKAYLSYIHHTAIIVFLAVFFGVMVWDVAVQNTIAALSPLVKDFTVLDKATKSLRIDRPVFLAISFSAIIFLNLCRHWVTTLKSEASKK